MLDESFDREELVGQSLLYAYNTLVNKNHRLLKELEGEISPTAAAKCAHEITDSLVTDALEDLRSGSMGGIELYDEKKAIETLRAMMEEYVEEWVDTGKLTEKDSSALKLEIDTHSDQGRRSHMEDRHVCIPDLNALFNLEGHEPQAFFAVYDGHGGVDAAKFAQTQVHYRIVNHPLFKDNVTKSIDEAFRSTDTAFMAKCDREALTSGATACAVLIRGNKLYVSWLGDSQAMLCRAGKPVELMEAHKPQLESEKKRIEAAGGVVVWYGAWRVNGVLSVARAIGDKKLKQWVIGEPGVSEFTLDGSEEYVIIACDGLWDCMTHDEVVDFVGKHVKEHGRKGVSKALVDHCIEKLSGSDNISVVVVFLK